MEYFKDYSAFNQKELKIKVVLLNFLMIMKYLKETGCIKKNGKFPIKEYRHGGRSGYEYYFGISLGRLLKEILGLKFTKQRNQFTYKSQTPFEKLVFTLDNSSLINKLIFKDIRQSLNGFRETIDNQTLEFFDRGERSYWMYDYREQKISNYSPMHFFRDLAGNIPAFSEQERTEIIKDNLVSTIVMITNKFSNRDVDVSYSSNSVQAAIDEIHAQASAGLSYSSETRQLVIDTAVDLMRSSSGMDISNIFTLTKTFLADNAEAQNVLFDDVVGEIQAAA